ncbi:DNA-processing protein DprA [Salipaludibacillus sp. HK11]|uniref:DNA-processing protein DprA n=1 Tax=Salipaludibacillus sp. HK11 TaxID=3394320 RepID=UPI0039FC5DC4
MYFEKGTCSVFIPRTFDDRLLHLHYSSFGNYSFIKKCLQYDQSLTSIYELSSDNFRQFFPRSHKKAATIFESIQTVHIDYLKAEFINEEIFYFNVFEEGYPSLLKEIYDPPWILYYKGNRSILNNPHRLAVVGTRHPSEFLKVEMDPLLIPIVNTPITVVSGMAMGVDTMAHELSMNQSGETIAVLAYGLNQLYPLHLKELKDRLQQRQLVITEYPPYVRPQRWHFPERNRIISGLSQATLILEAKQKSGSLITGDCALQQNRDVFALPGRISNPQSEGTNRLIQQGAKLILSANDIIEEYL